MTRRQSPDPAAALLNLSLYVTVSGVFATAFTLMSLGY
ncbi:hypothetical protein LDDCCGHA_0936 [Methylobacterium oxalidis]|nr:hypothetical protein LDDCCGHA_0936 [Methylobacterium oxalidis]